uniref:ATP synthase F0 subunit 6 n=1 Tax=Neoseiulus californicus TaxID=84382 RepID=UPI0022DCE3DC|nr:ATP synthase F0 subunit 6 [Neoseiulus californicus]UZU69612.1 ATP synthase F0 subunit 6 [Neoseiulus californicus]WJN56892.1 ATP synthase F0 subunit 6 [Neoseiulus californicus]WKV28862.1 ATP synthase F0 subunit 6 [Neoseiulus californicus]
MMANLFSMFDPSTNIFHMNWFSLIIPLLILKNQFYKNNSRIYFLFSKLNLFIISNIKNNIIKPFYKSLLIFLSWFSFIYLSNLLSLMPFIFAPTSHMSLTLTLSTPFWVSLMLTGWLKSPSEMFIHLVPNGTPNLLCPFMVIIETISNMIRPLTLSIRLSANMVAGHILISLLSNFLSMNTTYIFPLSLALNILTILETSVALIQGYVFIILMSLYLSDINN